MRNYKVKGNFTPDFSGLALITYKKPLRVELTNQTGTTISLAGQITTDLTTLSFPKHSKYRIDGLYLNGVLQPETAYTYDYLTGEITFTTTGDFTSLNSDNVLILLK